jgi:enamine deaminase RidA (YjgF/YER057c/UK114 family)
MTARILTSLVVVHTALSFSPLAAQTPSPANAIAKEKFNLDKAGEDEVGYAQAIKVGSTIYVSGSVGEGKDMRTQLRQAYESIGKSLAKYGATFQNVVKENVFATDLEQMIKHKDVRRDFYKGDWPAASWVGVQRLYVPALLVQVEVIAELPKQ